MTHLSDSQAQRDAELLILSALSAREGVVLKAGTVALEAGVFVALDGYDRDRRWLCEAYAHIGPTKPGHRQKIARDMLKLAAVERVLGGVCRKILCFADSAASRCVEGRSWLAAVSRSLGFEIIVLPLPPDVELRVRRAQSDQIMVNRS